MHRAFIHPLPAILSILALVSGSVAAAQDASGSEPVPTHVITRTVEYYREAPSEGQAADGTLRAGTRVSRLDDSVGEYERVRTPEGLEAFVPTRALAPIESAAEDRPGTHAERLTVTASVEEVTWAPLGTNSSVLEPEQVVALPSTVTALVTDIPGVSENGQGGLFQVVSIRGVSRQRVTHLVSGMRLASDRRAGVSTSFIDPNLIGSVEVLGGPATTFHGSGALGGVVQVHPREFGGGLVAGGYESNGNETFLAGGVGGEGWSIGAARRDADDAEAADGSLLNSHFTQTSAVASWSRESGGRRYEVMAIPTLGEEIGKANTDFPTRTTNYPRERHGLVKFSVSAESGWRLNSFVHAHDLETDVVEESVSRNRVFNDSFDFGLRWERERELRGGSSLRVGFDGFGRSDVDAEEIVESLDPGNPVPPVANKTLDGASELETAGFAAVRWSAGKTTLEGGARVTWQRQDNGGSTDRDDWAPSGYFGLSRPIGERLEVRGSLSTGLRFPGLGELFFSGTTARGEVIGNPDLDSERSYNAQASVRWLGRRALFEVVLFRNRIEDYIERIEIAPDLLTFANLTSGTISGIELRAMLQPAEGWRLFWGGHLMQGRAADDEPLADIPPDELFFEATRTIKSWTLAGRIARRFEKNDPGSGEKAIPAATLLSLSAIYAIGSEWSIRVEGDNLLDEEYFPAADRKAALARGRSAAIRVVWQGG